MKMNIKIFSFDSETNSESEKPVKPGEEAVLHFELVKENSEVDNRIVVQKHKKIKDVSWWIMVGDTDNNLLALKKVSVKKKVTMKVQIDVPENLRKTKVHAYLLADSYIGLDQATEISLS